MSDEPIQSASATQSSALAQVRRRRSPAIKPSHLGSHGAEQEAFQHQAELTRLSQGLSVDWIDSAARALAQVETGMRRNLLRNLSLDAMAVGLDRN